MCVTRIGLGLLMTAGTRLTSSRRLIFVGLVIALEFVHYQRRPNVVYASLGVSLLSRDVLMNAQCPHKWWSVRIRLFILLLGGGGSLVCKSVGKAICCQHILIASCPGIL